MKKQFETASGNQKEHHSAQKCLKATFMLVIVIVASLLIVTLPSAYASSQNNVGLHSDDTWKIDVQSNEIGDDECTFYKMYNFFISNEEDDSDEQIEEIKITFTPGEEGIIEDKSSWHGACAIEQVAIYTIIGRNVLENGHFGMHFLTGETKRMVPPFSIKREVDNFYFESPGVQTVTIRVIPRQSNFVNIWIDIMARSTSKADVRILSTSMSYFKRVTEQEEVGFLIDNPRKGHEYVVKAKLQITPKKGKVSYIPGVWTAFREIDDKKGSIIGKTASITTDFGTGEAVSLEELNFRPAKKQSFGIHFNPISSSTKLIIEKSSTTPAPTPITPVITQTMTYTLSGGKSPSDTIFVDDDLEVQVNGKTVFLDDNSADTESSPPWEWKGDPITFTASPGDTLRIIATDAGVPDVGVGDAGLSALYLHVGGQSFKLTDGIPSRQSKEFLPDVFFDESYTIPAPASFASTPSVTPIPTPVATPTPTPTVSPPGGTPSSETSAKYPEIYFIVPLIGILVFIVVLVSIKYRGKEKKETIESTPVLEQPVSPIHGEQKEQSKKIIGHEVFICHSSEDKPVADAMCGIIESKGIKCWIAPRDILPGVNYQEALIDAIDGSQIMTLIFSSRSNNSPHVIRELTEAFSKGVIIIPFRIEDVPLSKSMKYLVGLPHWLDALTPPLEQHLEKLAETIRLLLNQNKKDKQGK